MTFWNYMSTHSSVSESMLPYLFQLCAVPRRMFLLERGKKPWGFHLICLGNMRDFAEVL